MDRHDPGDLERSGWFERNAAVLCAAAAAVLYLPTLVYGLVWDDNLLVRVMDGRVRSGGVAELLLSDFRLYPWEATGYYRPVAMLSLWWDRLLSGVFPYSFHLTNVLLHGLVSGLVASAGRLLTGSSPAGLLAGLLFAVHPSHVESVAFVSGRTDLFAAAFVMLSLLAWLRDRSGAPSRWLPWAAWGGLSYFLACLSKEVGVLLPAVALGWDAVFPAGAGSGARGGWWRRNRWWCASWGLSLAAVAALRWGAAGLPLVPGGPYADSHVGEALRDWTLVPSMWLEYLRMLVAPWPLKVIYTPDQLGLTAWTALGALGFGALAWATSGAGTRRAGLWGSLWVLAFLLPVSGVVPLHGAVVAERFLYLPSAGFCLMAGAAASRVPDLARLPRPALAAAAAAAAVLLSAGVLSGSRHWRDEVTLFARAVRVSPEAWLGHYNLANALRERGRAEEAMAHYREAIRIKPGFVWARNNLGVLLESLGRMDEAAGQYREALRIRPGDPFAHKNLGNALARRGRFDEAAVHYREVLRTRPNDVQAHYNLGISLRATGRGAEADAHLAEAARLRTSEGGGAHRPR